MTPEELAARRNKYPNIVFDQDGAPHGTNWEHLANELNSATTDWLKVVHTITAEPYTDGLIA